MSERAERALVFDPFSGVSGDMILGGLVAVGLSEEVLLELPARLKVEAAVHVSDVRRGQLTAKLVRVEAKESGPHRHLKDVLAILEKADIPSGARSLANETFEALAEAEASVHGVPIESVHFHEVGAVDAIVDIVGVALGVTELGVARCFTRPVAVGRGWTRAEHGELPLPAPATLKLLEEVTVSESAREGELTTPTGAALLRTLSRGQTPPATYVPLRSGFGAGSRDPETHPNCLRLILAEVRDEAGLCVAQADIDDMSPEYVPPLVEALFDAGALDVWTHPVQMKKGRQGLRIEALTPRMRRQEVAGALFAASSSIGLRFYDVEREVLPRTAETLEWRGFHIRVKTSLTPAGHVRKKPEYEDVIRASQALGMPPMEARREIERALESGEVPQ